MKINFTLKRTKLHKIVDHLKSHKIAYTLVILLILVFCYVVVIKLSNDAQLQDLSGHDTLNNVLITFFILLLLVFLFQRLYKCRLVEIYTAFASIIALVFIYHQIQTTLITNSWQLVYNKTTHNAGKSKALENLAKRKEDLSEIDLSCMTMLGGTTTPTTVKECNGKETFLKDLDLSLTDKVNLQFADFSGTNLENAKFPKVNLKNAKFLSANLENAEFLSTNLTGVDFSDADLENAKFPKADLKNAKFPGTTLTGVDFSHADLENANFSGVDLKDANFSGAVLKGVNFSHANFENTDITFSDMVLGLGNANFSGAVLKGVNFSFTDLRNVDLSDATINNMKFYGATL